MAIAQKVRYEADLDKEFAQWTVATIGGERIRQCIQCGVCSAICPLSSYMDYTPRRLIHLARDGFKDEVLRSFTIWLCAACYACTVACPKQIKVTEVMHAFKQRAIREGVYPRRFPVPVLEREFFSMVRSLGRVSEIWLVMLLFLKTNIFKAFGMITLGWRLLRTGRIALIPESIKRRRELQALLAAVEGIPAATSGSAASNGTHSANGTARAGPAAPVSAAATGRQHAQEVAA